jgi:hypothetical protein
MSAVDESWKVRQSGARMGTIRARLAELNGGPVAALRLNLSDFAHEAGLSV